MTRHRFNPKRDPKPRLPKAPLGETVPLVTCQQHDRVMGLAADTEAEVQFIRTTAAGRVAVVFWTPFGASYREYDPDVQVKLVRREAHAAEMAS
jgi:hypothetical protein